MAKKHRDDVAPPVGNIYLTGFMCSGKTLAGRALARALGRPFLDSDQVIERNSGLCAGDFILRSGLGNFRKAEAAAVKELASGAGAVIALGGGYYPSGGRAALLSRTGFTVFLDCPWSELEKRLSRAQDRPLLAGPWEKASLRAKKLYAARLAYYRRADITLNTSGLSPKETAGKIAAVIKRKASRRR